MTRSRRQLEAARKKRLQKAKASKAGTRKDPGVPQLGRFAAHLQQQSQKRQERAAAAQQRQEAAREAALGQRRSLAGLQQEALRRQRRFQRKEEVLAEPEAQEEASLRQYGRELRKVLEASDVVLEVLDARDPQGCRSPALEAAVRRAGPRQRLVLVLNKIDLVPRGVVAAWLKHLRAELPTVAFKASTQQQSHNLKQSRLPAATAPQEVLAGGGCLGADCLLRLLGSYSRGGGVKTTLTVGVVGYPNVGKSSLINSLKRSRACGVGATPGVTRCLQAVQLDRHIQLLDCPGVVMDRGAGGGGRGSPLPLFCPPSGGSGPPAPPGPPGTCCCHPAPLPPEQLSEVFGVPPALTPCSSSPTWPGARGGSGPGGSQTPRLLLWPCSGTGTVQWEDLLLHQPPQTTQGEQLEAQILTALGPAFDLEALERGDEEALAAVPVTVAGIGLAPAAPEEEEREEEAMEGSEEEEEENNADLELGAVTVELKPPRARSGGGREGAVPQAPSLEQVAALDPLLQGQGLKAAAKRRKKLQKRAEKISTKLSESLEAAMQL